MSPAVRLTLALALLARAGALRLTTRRTALAAAIAPAAAFSRRATAANEEEPAAVSRLYALVDGHRPSDFKDLPAAAVEIDALIDEIVRSRAPWPRGELAGLWRLAYLQPGPDGTGVDRRIPFPEFDFNDSYQRFGESSVLNIGELLGPTLRVEVGGTLTEEDASVVRSPKRFRADITGGGLCLGSLPCAPLPIKGVGLFDGVYLGRRLRIGQNLNGGGARIVQLRVG